jgi:hypothetical protein
MITITLKAKFHALIISLMGDRGNPRKVNYINQVRRAIGQAGYDPEQDISVTVDPSLVTELYEVMGTQEERMVNGDNTSIKAALIPQLQAHPEVLQAVGLLAQGNAQLTEQKRQSGIEYIMSIEP